MRNKKGIFAAAVFLLLALLPVPAAGAAVARGAEYAMPQASESETDAVSRSPEDAAREIWEYELAQADVSDYEEYLRVGLAPYAGTGTEWLLLCLVEWRPKLDYSVYNSALDMYLDSAGSLKATDYQRIYMVKSALSVDGEEIGRIIRDHTGREGIMSSIYGLILANSGNYLTREERLGFAAKLVELQLEDGGFALSGKYGDADITAMALQALAPYRDEYEDEIDRALERLSVLQRENGGFASYGIENAESCAQVLMALCALDIDYREDSRFIKNSRTVWDAIGDYACGGGGYSHLRGGAANSMATVQVLTAALCLRKYEAGEGFIYDFNREEPPAETIPEPQPTQGSAAETEPAQPPTENYSSGGDSVGRPGGGISGRFIKTAVISFIALCAAAALAVTALRRRLDRLRALKILIPAVLLAGFTAFSRIETREEHYDALYVEGGLETYISVTGYDGVILSRTKIMAREGGTAFEQLRSALARQRVNVDYGGNEKFGNIYVRGIGGLSEFDYGSLSGWTYRVNGEYPNVSCASFVLEENDYVEWIYTDDGAEDGLKDGDVK